MQSCNQLIENKKQALLLKTLEQLIFNSRQLIVVKIRLKHIFVKLSTKCWNVKA